MKVKRSGGSTQYDVSITTAALGDLTYFTPTTLTTLTKPVFLREIGLGNPDQDPDHASFTLTKSGMSGLFVIEAIRVRR